MDAKDRKVDESTIRRYPTAHMTKSPPGSDMASRMYTHSGDMGCQADQTELFHATWRQRAEVVTHLPRHAIRHRHAAFHLVLVMSGEGSFDVAGQERPFTAPWLFLTGPGLPHSFSLMVAGAVDYDEVTLLVRDQASRLVTYDWSELLASWFGSGARAPLEMPMTTDAALELDRSIQALVTAGYAGGMRSEGMIRGLVLSTLFQLWQSVAHGEERRSPLDQVRCMIEANLADPPSLLELARVAGLSPKHLSRAFAQHYGSPPLRWAHQAQMRQAMVLLRSSTASVADIARELGYEDPHYFNRRFQQIIGTTPGRFRRQRGP
jgi:AraC-like DNA-binding protein